VNYCSLCKLIPERNLIFQPCKKQYLLGDLQIKLCCSVRQRVGLKVEACNKHDAAAIASALHSGRRSRSSTNFFGGEAIEKGFAADFPPVVRKLLQVYAIEDRIATISE
jgi:hypothetical protein